MKKAIVLSILTILASFVVICSVVFAVDIQDLQTQKKDLQTQIDGANEEMANIQIELTDNLAQLDVLNQKIIEYENQINELSEDLNSTQEDVDIVTEKLNYIKLDYNNQKKVLEKRLVALYEAGETHYLDVLLSSSNISDFISNYYLISEIASYDEELLNNIEREKNSIESIQDILQQKKDSLSTLMETQERTKTALENSKILKTTYVEKLTEEEKATQEKLDEFQEDLNNVENQILQATNIKVGDDYAGGELEWPAPGYTTITSPFGMRYHPVFNVYRMHTGTDIGAPTGANVVAANDGVVTKSMYSNSYGNMIIIDHGGGVSTLYGHGSQLIAEVGQEVKRGEVIMLAGSTGWSTGPHLHFEVRINGEYVDPLPYITHSANLESDVSDKKSAAEKVKENLLDKKTEENVVE